jgi:hypothetical protein
MTEHEEVLEGTVDEAKDSIRDLDDPDYESLLEAEKEDKNRKTLVSWLESRVEAEQEEESGGEDGQEEPDDVDEAVEQVERQTAGGLGGSFSSGQIALGGLLVGLIIGLASGTLVGDTGMSAEPGASTDQIREDVSTLVSQGQTQDVSIASVETRNEMFFVNVRYLAGNHAGLLRVAGRRASLPTDKQSVLPQPHQYSGLACCGAEPNGSRTVDSGFPPPFPTYRFYIMFSTPV